MRFDYSRSFTLILVFLLLVFVRRSFQYEQNSAADSIDRLEKLVGALARQISLQQFYVEEQTRSMGNSGLKQVRIRSSSGGTRSYFYSTYTNPSVASIHDHSNNIRTVGMGEFVAVLNGVEFRTRHNDYRLQQPSKSTRTYHAMDDIEFPDVPPQVLNKSNITEQIEEMREWFKAWRDGSRSPRDYTKYFKPALCYLEGAWTNSSGLISEPFFSDRHKIDANSWHDLQQKIQFASHSGGKSNLENYAYLPTTIIGFDNTSKPIFAQWNYRIACHPLKRNVPLKSLRLVDELGVRMALKKAEMEKFGRTRSARFQLSPSYTQDSWPTTERRSNYDFLDALMAEIPGKDNYGANLTDDAFGLVAGPIVSENLQTNYQLPSFKAGYYHRWYKVEKKGAMGSQVRSRGFSDASIYMAMNSQKEVSPLRVKSQCTGRGKNRKCIEQTQRWSYAIPLELVYLTPLSKWNPYKIAYRGAWNANAGKSVTESGNRNGHKENKEKAFNGTNSKLFYQTPAEFFSGGKVEGSAADTDRGTVGVLDKDGRLRLTQASGTRIFFPSISGVGSLRQRYPIMPIHGEGNPIWKELDALKDLVMEQGRYLKYFRTQPIGSGGAGAANLTKDRVVNLVTGPSNAARGYHVHQITLTESDIEQLEKNQTVDTTTSEADGHTHSVRIRWRHHVVNGHALIPYEKAKMIRCDNLWWKCWDGHIPRLNIDENT